MKIEHPIDLNNVEALTQCLSRQKVLRPRFSLEIPERDACNALYAALKVEVESRGRDFQLTQETLTTLQDAARWLIDPKGSPWLMFMGLVGNGKTSLAKAIGNLIHFLSEREYGPTHCKKVRFIKAKTVCQLCGERDGNKEARDDYGSLFTEELLIIDDLGEEPNEVMVFGNVYTPVKDLLSERYDSRMFTIITTNLDADRLCDRYGPRIYDRMKEVYTSIAFLHESYRAQEDSNPVVNQ